SSLASYVNAHHVLSSPTRRSSDLTNIRLEFHHRFDVHTAPLLQNLLLHHTYPRLYYEQHRLKCPLYIFFGFLGLVLFLHWITYYVIRLDSLCFPLHFVPFHFFVYFSFYHNSLTLIRPLLLV